MAKLLFLTLLFFGVAIRFIWLDKVPPGLSHDEVDPIHTARTYVHFGTDSAGTRFPTSLITSQANSGDDTLLSLFYAPFYQFLPSSLFTIRLPTVFINLLTAVSLFVLTYRVSHNKHLAGIFLLVYLFSPWSVLFSRSLTQAPLALLFILLSFNMFIKFNYIPTLVSSFFLFMGFFTYYGAKPLTLVLSFVFPFLARFFRISRFRLRFALVFFFIFITFVGVYFFFSSRLPTSTYFRRQGEVQPFNLAAYTRSSDEFRRVTIDSPLAPFFSNKPILFITSLAQKYYSFFSPDILYFSGDVDPNFRFLDHGISYLIDGPLFLLGIPAMLSSPIGLLAIVMMIVGPIGTVVNTSSTGHLFRGFLFYPGYLLVVSLGLFSIYRKLGQKGIIVLSICYSLLAINFLYFFWFRFPVSQSESFFLGDRVLANYILRLPTGATIVTSQPYSLAQEISVFGQIKDGRPPQLVSNTLPITLSNAVITNTCPTSIHTPTLIIQSGFDCQLPTSLNPLVIQSQKDAGSLWKIYSDPLCQDYPLSAWRRFHLRSDYDLERMSTSTFCERWIQVVSKLGIQPRFES